MSYRHISFPNCSTVFVGAASAIKYQVIGTDGQLLDSMLFPNAEPWFPRFVEEQGRFAFGFDRIKNAAVIDGLRKLLLENTLR